MLHEPALASNAVAAAGTCGSHLGPLQVAFLEVIGDVALFRPQSQRLLRRARLLVLIVPRVRCSVGPFWVRLLEGASLVIAGNAVPTGRRSGGCGALLPRGVPL